MCGIFAISGERETAGNIVLKGLKKLEYRGYDSWGIAIRDAGKISIEKQIGKISGVKKDFGKSTESMGHTRWATHGGVTNENAHPHKFGKITLVHNGIFENFLEVKKEIGAEKFKSETDTEVIAALLDELLETGLEPDEAIREAAKKIVGRFAILVMVEGIPGLFAARRGSPLILGRGKTETFIASDIPAFLEYTNTVNYLDDNEMVYISGGTAIFSNLKTGDPITKRDITVNWKIEEAEKGEFEHFMIKEIFDQKDTIARAINHDDELLKKAVKLLQESNGAYFIACGTAHKVTSAAEYFFAEISGRKINVVPAGEMPSFEKFVNEETALIAISQSGETADVLEILERGKKVGAKILAITNVETSSVARIADVHLPIQAGVEKAVASTKAATAQMALCFLLAYADAENIRPGSINRGREILRSTASSINDLLNPRYAEYVEAIAEKIVDRRNMFIIGRGALYPMALESAIKIQEVSYIHAQGFAAGELKHGPIALIEKRVPCLVLGDDSETISNAMELKARGARIIGIAPTRADVFDEWLRVPDCNGAQAIASIIPVQLLAYHLAILKGLDPDMPRNLAKSVTVK
ncbi:glutamine--fructose-6-phosphate transaminase (isomerizing) [bacterium]|jgi:glutamine---fructose-6-phosphate transaminase (isomerizing)|nr:glutamine--fructose-6-phosphate transaminase (isomerizing) [bacterium]MBT6832035.1 glutamine--fructose-6-phosphate transaminase (isomerizing) [bacterium]MBT6995816.1 glutamine--fructose-6-phosphate transaminase (isomerizing) [bacterium]MBT7772373.1 glutamine--fructose-6-phosphate transaminase (isomerizing) [bacterium]